jgi:predicted cupin superfamily sugar epimerase
LSSRKRLRIFEGRENPFMSSNQGSKQAGSAGTKLTAEKIQEILNLKPLPIEGGYFVETYRSGHKIAAQSLSGNYEGDNRDLATAIYYLLTPESFSAMHRVPGDEIFHFYLGDPIEMLQLAPDGKGELVLIGADIVSGQRPQHSVPGGYWQGSRLCPGGKFALLGTTMSPGFDYHDYESGKRDELSSIYPVFSSLIEMLTR